ncbi:Snf7 family protein [Xylona heveae TC161]|uniref:Snf7 family protein n=1 Tax=Xylona heveae (strain CBS 132557 / TC161) TaxID=1328760 RepID=A0A165HAW9_XYLHT|nr:Snf7 family protein [Xylona heveae TC161]KZF23232.1 Snf7 family protein [Xylona heveae TC161]
MSELLNFILNHEEQFRRARLASLYSDFRHQQTTNPDGYNANIVAWQTALANAARAGLIPAPGAGSDHLTLRTGEDLLRELETKEWGRPLALGAVINEAVAQKQLLPLQEFLTTTTSIYHKSWIGSPWSVISWGLRQLGVIGGVSGEDKLSVGQFAIVGNIEETARKILQQTVGKASAVDRIYSQEIFRQDFVDILGPDRQLTDTDFRVLLTFLARDKREIAFDGQTIKFKSPNEQTPSPITKEDASIASLKALILSLQTQVETLQSRVETSDTAARQAVSAKNRVAALSALRSKKLAEVNLNKRSETLAQLEQVYDKIEQATDQVEIVRVMEASVGVLKGLNKQIGDVDKVEDVVHELRDEMGKVDEVGAMIADPGLTGVHAPDEADVDEEFEELEQEERKKKEAIEQEQQRQREEAEAEQTRRKLEELDQFVPESTLQKDQPDDRDVKKEAFREGE